MFARVREPINSLTHFMGFLAGIPLLFIMIDMSKKASLNVLAFAVFGISLLLLYGASSVYHAIIASKEKIAFWRKIDHMMIFVLIAGTYTPICATVLTGAWRIGLLIGIWGFAAFGIILKIFFNVPRWVSTAIYVIMGWMAVFAFFPLIKALPLGGIALLVLGGLTYTAGAVIYALRPSNINIAGLGFHEIFHLFVLGGSLFHVIFMFMYLF